MSSNPNRLTYELAVDFSEKEQITAAFRKIRDSFEDSTRIFSTAGAEAQKLVTQSIDAGNRLQQARRAEISELLTLNRRERDATSDKNRAQEREYKSLIDSQIATARSAAAAENAARTDGLARFRQDLNERRDLYKQQRDLTINAAKDLVSAEIASQKELTAVVRLELKEQEKAHKASVQNRIDYEKLLVQAQERSAQAAANVQKFGDTIPRSATGALKPDLAQLAEGQRLAKDYEDAQAAVQLYQEALNRATGESFKQAAQVRLTNAELEKQISIEKTLAAQGDALIAETTADENQKYQATRNRLARELIDERSKVQTVNRLKNEEVSAFASAENQKLAILRAANRAEEREELRQHQETLDRLRRELAASVEAERELSRIRQQTRRAGEDQNRIVGELGSVVGNVGSIATQAGIGLTAAITAPTLLAAKLGLEFVNVREKFVAAYAAATGSTSKEALAAFREIQQTAKDTGISLDSMVQSSLRLADAGLAGERLSASLRAASAVGQLAADRGDDATQAAEAYGRILGKIQQQQQINGRQLDALNNQGIRATDALIAAYERENGVLLSAAALKDKLRKGEISGEFAIDALNKELNDRFQGRLQGRTKELSGAFEALKTSVREAFGEALLPVVDRLTEAFNKLQPKVQAITDKFAELSDNQKLAVVSLVGVTAAIGPAFVAFGTLLNVLQNVIEAYKALLGIQLLSGAALGKTVAGVGGAAATASTAAAAATVSSEAALLAGSAAANASVSALAAGESAAFAAAATAEVTASSAAAAEAAAAAGTAAGASAAAATAVIAVAIAAVLVAIDVIRRVWTANSDQIRETFQFAMAAVQEAATRLTINLRPLWEQVVRIYETAIAPLVAITDRIFKQALLIIQQFFNGVVGNNTFQKLIDGVTAAVQVILNVIEGVFKVLSPIIDSFTVLVLAAIDLIGGTVRIVMRLVNAIIAGDLNKVGETIGEFIGYTIGVVSGVIFDIGNIILDGALYMVELTGRAARQAWEYLKTLSAKEVLILVGQIVAGIALLPALIAEKAVDIGYALWEGIKKGFTAGANSSPLPSLNFNVESEGPISRFYSFVGDNISRAGAAIIKFGKDADDANKKVQLGGAAAGKAADSAAKKAEQLLETIRKATAGVELSIQKLRTELGASETQLDTIIRRLRGNISDNETQAEANARAFRETVEGIASGGFDAFLNGQTQLVEKMFSIRAEAEDRIAKFKIGKEIKTQEQVLALQRYEAAERLLAENEIAKLSIEAGKTIRDFKQETLAINDAIIKRDEPYQLRLLEIAREIQKIRESTQFTSKEEADAAIKARENALKGAAADQYKQAFLNAERAIEKQRIQSITNERARVKALIDYEYAERLRLLTIEFGGSQNPDAVANARKIADAEKAFALEEEAIAQEAITRQLQEQNELLRIGGILDDDARQSALDKFNIEKAFIDALAQGLTLTEATNAANRVALDIQNQKLLGAKDALTSALSGSANPLLANKPPSEDEIKGALDRRGGNLEQLRRDIEAVQEAFRSAGASVTDFETRVGILRNLPTTLGGTFKSIGEAFKQIAKDALFSKQAIAGIATAFGSALGQALASQESLGQKLKAFFFNLIGDLAIQFGSFLIAFGVGMTTVASFLGFTTGPAAVAAGIALVALGSALKALAGTASAAAETGGGAASAGSTGGPEGRERDPQRLPFGTSGEFLIEVEFKNSGDDDLGKAVTQHMIKNGAITVTSAGRQHRRQIRDANG